MTRLLLALLLCAACKHSSSSSSTSHTETSTVTDSTSSETGTQTTVTTTSEAPGKTTTTVEDYGPPEEVMPSESEPGSVRAVPDGGVPATPGAVSRPSHGPLVRRTVTVTEHGEKDTTARQEASTQGTAASETKRNTEGDTKTKGKSTSAPSAGCIGSSWLIGIGAILFAVALILGILKFRRAV